MSWKPSLSFLGACCSFNYNPLSDDDTYFKVEGLDITGAITLIGSGEPEISDGKSGVLYSDGFMLLIHHPHDFAVFSHPIILVEIGRESYIELFATDLTCTAEVIELAPKQRECVIGSDVGISRYRRPACILYCTIAKIYATCKCHPYFLPRPTDGSWIRECEVNDVMCFVDHFCKYDDLLQLGYSKISYFS